MKKYLMPLLILATQNIYASEIAIILQPSQISLIQMHTTKNISSGSVNTAILATTALQPPCTKGVYIDAETDKATFSTALAAITSGKQFRLLYNTSIGSPWGDAAWCAVSAFGITN